MLRYLKNPALVDSKFWIIPSIFHIINIPIHFLTNMQFIEEMEGEKNR